MAVPLLRLILLASRARRNAAAPPLSTQQVIVVIAGTIVVFNGLFFLLSGMYFDDRTAFYGATSAEHIMGVRIAFGVFAGVVGAAAMGSVPRPGWFAIGIPAVTSIAALVAGVAAATHDMTPVLPGSLIVTGIVMAILVWRTLEGSRAAWSFLIGMTSVLSAVLLFGATKVAGVMGTGLWIALIIPGLLAVATTALTRLRTEFGDAPAATPAEAT